MAINLFEGLPGHGKTIEAAELMAKKLSEGVNCASNIEGLDAERMAHYIETHNFKVSKFEKIIYAVGRFLFLTKRNPATEGVPREQQGRLRIVAREELLKDSFYPDPDRPDVPSVLQQGENLFVDEAQEIFRRREKLTPHIENYFTKHRHSVDPVTGISANIILITQDGANLNTFVHSLIELTIVCEKMKKAGLSNVYITEFYNGGYQSERALIGSARKFYNKEIYELYKSYSGDTKGVEIQVDDRQNFWKNPFIWLVLLGVIVFGVFGYGYLYRWTHPDYVKNAQKKNSLKTSAMGSIPNLPGAPQAKPIATQHEQAKTRLVGYYTASGRAFIVLQDSDGRMRYQTRGAGTVIDGPRTVVQIDGNTVATFSGVQPELNNKSAGMFGK